MSGVHLWFLNCIKVRGWKNIFHANGKQKKAGVAILISDKIDCKRKITRDKEGYYIMIKGSIQEEDITIVNIYAPNIGNSQYIRQTLTDKKGETDSNTIIVGDFNTPLTPMDRSPKQKINKETQVLNDTLHEKDLIAPSGHSIQMQNTSSSQVHMEHSPGQEHSPLSNIHQAHILGHKSNLSKFKKIKIISSVFSNHKSMRLDINYNNNKKPL